MATARTWIATQQTHDCEQDGQCEYPNFTKGKSGALTMFALSSDLEYAQVATASIWIIQCTASYRHCTEVRASLTNTKYGRTLKARDPTCDKKLIQNFIPVLAK